MKKKFLHFSFLFAASGLFLLSSCKKEDTVSQAINSTNPAQTISEEGYNGQTSGGINSFPVELLRFDGGYMNKQVVFEWATASETDCFCFEVERSTDLINYSIVAKYINPISNSTVQKNYTEVDPFPISGQVYYRLKQVFTDHTYEVYCAIAINIPTN